MLQIEAGAGADLEALPVRLCEQVVTSVAQPLLLRLAHEPVVAPREQAAPGGVVEAAGHGRRAYWACARCWKLREVALSLEFEREDRDADVRHAQHTHAGGRPD